MKKLKLLLMFILIVFIHNVIIAQRKNHKVWDGSDYSAAIYEVKGMKSKAAPVRSNIFYVQTNIGASGKFHFQGVCSDKVTIKGSINLYHVERDKLFEKYKSTGNPKDLPNIKYLESTVVALSDQCPQLKIINLEYSINDTENYLGIMRIENKWKLEDVGVKKVIDITGIDFFNRTYKAKYKGDCKKSITAKIEKNGWMSKKLDFYYYRSIIKDFISKLQCDEVSEVRFEIQDVPRNWRVKPGKEKLLIVKKEDNWKFSKENFEKDLPSVIIKDANELLKYIELKKFSDLSEYTSLFKSVYTDYLKAYGEFCRTELEDYSTIEVQSVEERYGIKKTIGEPEIIYLEKKYLNRYKIYLNNNKSWWMLKLLNKGRNYMSEVSKLNKYQNQVKQFVKNNCSNGKAKVVYENLNLFASSIE